MPQSILTSYKPRDKFLPLVLRPCWPILIHSTNMLMFYQALTPFNQESKPFLAPIFPLADFVHTTHTHTLFYFSLIILLMYQAHFPNHIHSLALQVTLVLQLNDFNVTLGHLIYYLATTILVHITLNRLEIFDVYLLSFHTFRYSYL